MLIDCDSCVMQDTTTCDECIVPILLAPTLRGAGLQQTGETFSDLAGTAIERVRPGPVELDEAEASALENLAEVGLVPRLKLVPKDGPPEAAAC